MTNYMETLSEVMAQLNKEGYTGNIPVDELKLQQPSDWVIDRINRFEGKSSPEDNTILYAISRKDGTKKALLVNAYGADSENEVYKFVSKLSEEK